MIAREKVHMINKKRLQVRPYISLKFNHGFQSRLIFLDRSSKENASKEMAKSASFTDLSETTRTPDKLKSKASTEIVKSTSRVSITRDNAKAAKASNSEKEMNRKKIALNNKSAEKEEADEISIEEPKPSSSSKAKESFQEKNSTEAIEKQLELLKPLSMFMGDNVTIMYLLDFVSKTAPNV